MSWVDVTTAVSTAGAVVVALYLGLKGEWRATRAERRARQEDERRQAVHVAAWMLVEQDSRDGPREIDADDPSFDARAAHVYEVVQNASDEPIWDVVINAPILAEKEKGGLELKFIETEDEIIFVGPHETRKSEITVRTLRYNRFPLKIEFRDNASRSWSRDERGRLHRGRASETMFGWLGAAERPSAEGGEPGTRSVLPRAVRTVYRWAGQRRNAA